MTDYNLRRLNPVLKPAGVIRDYTVLTVTVILTELYKLIRIMTSFHVKLGFLQESKEKCEE